jgi:5-methyltetrahydropteroyltriglutamate--homocysteine methyltransferase
MKTGETRIFTTHAGSLPRPASLTALHAKKFAGESVDETILAAEAATAVESVVRRQAEAGIDIGNNGEAPRESFFTYVQHRMSGFGDRSFRPIMADIIRYEGFLALLTRQSFSLDNVSLMAAPKAIGTIAYTGTSAIEAECAQLSAALEKAGNPFVEAFVSSPSPGIIAAAMQNAHYDSLPAYIDAVAAALGQEYRAIVDAGFILQIDAPDLAMERHTLFADKPLGEFLAFVRVVIAAINRALDALPKDRVRLHVCWGNYEGPHDLDVALSDIWSEIEKAKAGAFMISMANPRHAHEVACFAHGELPADAIFVPGVIDTTTNYIEHPGVVALRIERAVQAVGDPKRVIAGTDCGFETSAGFGAVVPEICWAKLTSMSEGAKIASQRIFG